MEDNTEPKTLDFQSQLPSLPLPPLEQTCTKYLESVQPFISQEEYKETVRKTQKFQDGVGRELQKKLGMLSSSSRNWLQDWWYDSYLDYRGPSPMISNIAGGYQPQQDYDKPQEGSNIVRASNWIHAMLQFYQIVIRQEYPLQLLAKRFPMDMSQYYSFFCAGRIPGEKRDIQVHYVHAIPQSDGTMDVIANVKHIVILIKGRIFLVKVFDDNGLILHPETIKCTLEEIKKRCDEQGEGEGVSALTCGKRDTWYKGYKHLCVLDRQNKTNINLINEAIFALSFEDVDTFELQDSAVHGITGGDKNRWLDKSCNPVVSRTGIIVSSEDHIHFDGNVGVTILQEAADILHASKCDIKVDYLPQKVEEATELKFVVDDEIRSMIADNIQQHRMLGGALEIIDRPLSGYGKSFAKLVGINPDTIVQLAIQLGYYSLHKRCVPTYESGTTRMFYNGRTETVRSCTSESIAWCEAMSSANKTSNERKKLFMKAVQKQDNLMQEACQGYGIDRHLFVLKKIAEREGTALPDIFTDKAYKASGGDANYVISTSLSGFTVLHGGMAPMVEDGYGVFYNINKDKLQLNVSAWKTSSTTNCSKFYDSIVTSFHTIRQLSLSSKL